MQAESGIAVEKSGDGIVQIRLNRPDRLNALGVDMVDDLLKEITDAVAGCARVIVIRGTGRAFCAGADLKERRTMDRLGVGAAELHKINPRLIYGSSSGYGKDGPYRDYPAMDLVMQAMSGIINSTGFPDQPPVKSGAAVCDFSAGIHLYGAIMVHVPYKGLSPALTD